MSNTQTSVASNTKSTITVVSIGCTVSFSWNETMRSLGVLFYCFNFLLIVHLPVLDAAVAHLAELGEKAAGRLRVGRTGIL